MSTKPIHEIYFRSPLSLEEFTTQLRTICNWPTTNGVHPQEHTHEETSYYSIHTCGLEFCIVPNTGPFLVTAYAPYQYYLFIRCNSIDKAAAKRLYSPLLEVLGNLFYRSGLEIEVDCVLLQQDRERIKAEDPLTALEDDLRNGNLLGQ